MSQWDYREYRNIKPEDVVFESVDDSLLTFAVPAKPTRKTYNPTQVAVLTDLFNNISWSPNFEVREAVGKKINMSNREVQIWCQNRRAKAGKAAIQTGTSQLFQTRKYNGPPPPSPNGSFTSLPEIRIFRHHNQHSIPVSISGSYNNSPLTDNSNRTFSPYGQAQPLYSYNPNYYNEQPSIQSYSPGSSLGSSYQNDRSTSSPSTSFQSMALSPGPYNLSPESYNPVGRLTLDVSHVFWVPPPSIRVNNNLIYFPTPPIQQLPPPIQLAPIRIKDPSISPDSPKIKLPSLRDVFSPNSNLKPVGKFQPMPSSLRDIRPDKEMMGLGMLDMTREPESSAEEMKKVGNYRRVSISER